MPGGHVAKRHRWSKGDTGVGGATITLAAGIEAFERNARGIEHLRIGGAGKRAAPNCLVSNPRRRKGRRATEQGCLFDHDDVETFQVRGERRGQ